MNQTESPKKGRTSQSAAIAIVFIAAGFIYLLRNMGMFDYHVSDMLISWKTLLIVIGVVCLAKRNFLGGSMLVFLGLYFHLSYAYGSQMLWPLVLIIVGVALLLKSRGKGKNWPFGHRQYGFDGGTYTSRDNLQEEGQGEGFAPGEGFINSDVTFSSARHIVLEPVFKGANLNVVFGGLVVDLRRTRLEMPQTEIRLNASFSGVELYVPSTWNIVVEADTTLSGFKDKRFLSQPVDTEHKLILRGDVTFSGVEIKN